MDFNAQITPSMLLSGRSEMPRSELNGVLKEKGYSLKHYDNSFRKLKFSAYANGIIFVLSVTAIAIALIACWQTGKLKTFIAPKNREYFVITIGIASITPVCSLAFFSLSSGLGRHHLNEKLDHKQISKVLQQTIGALNREKTFREDDKRDRLVANLCP